MIQNEIRPDISMTLNYVDSTGILMLTAEGHTDVAQGEMLGIIEDQGRSMAGSTRWGSYRLDRKTQMKSYKNLMNILIAMHCCYFQVGKSDQEYAVFLTVVTENSSREIETADAL